MSNWLRWCRAEGVAPQHCGSIEYLYVQSNESTATGWGDWQSPDAAPRQSYSPIDVVDAKFLDSVFLTLPEKVRRVIKLFHFKRHLKLEWIARKIGVHQSKVEEEVARAVDTFAMAVMLHERIAGIGAMRRSARIAA
jgi:hypothetical protein